MQQWTRFETVLSTPADDLVSLETVKSEFSITVDDVAADARMTRWIKEETAAIQEFVGRPLRGHDMLNRFYPKNFYRSTNDDWPRPHYGNQPPIEFQPLSLSRWPVASITSIAIDGTPVTTYETNPEIGLVWMLDTSGNRQSWYGQSVDVTYHAGWDDLGTVPFDVQRALLTLVSYRIASKPTERGLRMVSIPGVMERMYHPPNTDPTALPIEVTSALDRFRSVSM